MEIGRFSLYIQKRQYEQIISCINVHTALKCIEFDKTRVEHNIERLCGPKHFRTNQQVQISTNPCRFIVIRNGNVIFHFQEGVDIRPTLRSKQTGIEYTFRRSCFNELCWLPLESSPAQALPKEAWFKIAQYLSIEDKQNMRLVNRSIGKKFDDDTVWVNDAKQLERVIQIPLPFRNMVSLKQAIFRTLLYIGTEKQFLDVFTGDIAHLFANCIGFKVYGDHNCSGCNENRRKRARTSVIVQTKCEKSNYKAEAKLAVGCYDVVQGVVSPLLWITPRGKLRYMNNYRKTKETWDNIQTYITQYRTKLLSELK